MNRGLLSIYILIMLECRLSLEDASVLFGIDPEYLRHEITNKKNLPEDILYATEYLIHETTWYEDENKRGLFKAQICLRRLNKIRQVKDKEERKRLLSKFIKALQGPDIRFALSKQSAYTPEEREKILKYRLKYGISSAFFHKEGYVGENQIATWENELPEGELKTRLKILRKFLRDKYYTHNSHKKR